MLEPFLDIIDLALRDLGGITDQNLDENDSLTCHLPGFCMA